MKKIAVFHFNPLEFYPPVMNLLDCLQDKLSENDQVLVYSTRPAEGMRLYVAKGKQIIIKRPASYTMGVPLPKRMARYLRYYLLSFLQCLRFRPSKVFYYETISSFTPWLLFKWPGSHIELFIHYHEYMNAEEYSRMILNKTFHRLEGGMYGKAKWISHNNAYRMRLFLDDLGRPGLKNTHIFPNYPPEAWISRAKDTIVYPVKLVYVGSMGSLRLSYIREAFEWIKSKNGAVLLDIYSFRVADEIKRFSEQLDCLHIRWKGSVAYRELPKLLKQYDVGLILYKGDSANIVYSASNKLFEYLTCGLDVWYPAELIGSHQYNSPDSWPKVLPLDFLKLDQYNLDDLIERKPAYRREITYTCENACADLVSLISA